MAISINVQIENKRNAFCKAIAAIVSDFSDGSGQNKLKNLLEKIYHSRFIKGICNSWEDVKISTFTGIWKKLILPLMDDFEQL